MTYFQAILLGLTQGVSELFPVSSLGHSVILPALLNWNIDESAPYFLVFLVAVHFATALVLLGFFWKDWVKIIRGFFISIKESVAHKGIVARDVHSRIGWLLVIGTIPAGILGLIFQSFFEKLFASPLVACIFLVANGLILYAAEFMMRRDHPPRELASDEKIAKLSWGQALKVGCAQAVALIPGLSRTGASLSRGLLVGLDHIDAARFSFLLATPIIFAAAVLKLPALIFHSSYYPMKIILVGALTAAIAAFFSIKFLTNYFETKTLKPFASYCVLAGIVFFIVILTHGN